VTAVLEIDGLSVRFGQTRALNDVSLALGSETVGLIGPNGAGKTTLLDTVTGFVRPVAGRVRFEGADISHLPAWRRARIGVRRTFQAVELFDDLTVEENLVAASRTEARPATWPLDFFGIGRYAKELAQDLPAGVRRLVGIARAVAGNPKVLLLDEPGAGLHPEEIDALGNALGHVHSELGMGILLVDHQLPLISLVCERVLVLNFGSVIASGTLAYVTSDSNVVQAYLGS